MNTTFFMASLILFWTNTQSMQLLHLKNMLPLYKTHATAHYAQVSKHLIHTDPSKSKQIANNVKKITRSYDSHYHTKYICLQTFAVARCHEDKKTGEKTINCDLPVYWSSSGARSWKHSIGDEDLTETVYEELEKRFEGKK